jgi:TolB-like protein/Flp pilus assembly protein TadD
MQAGTRLGPYEIVAPLGAGGMGEVYRARDTRLGRDVAIKVLSAEFTEDPDRMHRFEQEARAVAALNHPNILALHDIGTHEGLPFIVTELLEGESLRERLSGGAMPVRKAIEVGIQIAQGLAAAHEKGIVHRDLKPANVFVTKDGHVKILDFGIAKLVGPRKVEDLGRATTVMEATADGTVLGTVGYMSPEQVRGEAVDHRSDIFSFGCVLYEMVTGRQPFARETGAETMTAILKEAPPEPSSLAGSVPPTLSRVIAHCLEKNPQERAHSAHDLAFDLRAILADASGTAVQQARTAPSSRRFVGLALAGIALLAAGAVVVFMKLSTTAPKAGAPGLKKIVVLPFENLGAPEDAYFAAGMTEEITSRLANVQGLGVISRTTAVEYDGKGKTVKQIGTDLGVDYVLEGSVRWEHGQGHENRVRITPQLIRAADDTHVWADRYDRVMADIFAIQSDVAERTVKAMGVALLPRERAALQAASTNDLEAYDLYLRARQLESAGEDREHVEGALRLDQAAVDRDPRFVEALAGLAGLQLLMYWHHYDHSEGRLASAKEAAERAVELRPDLAETHIALGYYYYHGLLDFPEALSQFSRALEIRPNSSEALAATGYVLRRQGRWTDAAAALGRALETDPQNATVLYNSGETLMLDRRFADADRTWGRAIAVSPLGGETYGRRAWLQVQWKGDLDGAQAILDEARRVAGSEERFLVLCGGWATRIAVARRDYPAALRLLDEVQRGATDNNLIYVPLSLSRATVQDFAGQQTARQSFAEARQDLEEKVRKEPGDARFHSSLGIAYAGLGRREEAVREARQACDLMPWSKDAWQALYRRQALAGVYTMVGMRGEAIATLDDLLATSGETTVQTLRLEPRWDPLRSDPRFQALLKKYEVNE